MALVSIAGESGDYARALRKAGQLLVLAPGDPQLRALVSELEGRAHP
jgi:hypothetical protein